MTKTKCKKWLHFNFCAVPGELVKWKNHRKSTGEGKQNYLNLDALG